LLAQPVDQLRAWLKSVLLHININSSTYLATC